MVLCGSEIRGGACSETRNGRITCRVTGSRQHSKDLLQGGLEIPCVLTFDTGDKDLISKIRKLLITTENFKIGDEPVIAETEIKSVETTGDSSKKRRIEIDCESYVPLNDDDEIWVRIEGIVLYMSGMNRLSGGLELTEAIINSAQKLLKSQFPTLQGLGLTFEDQPCIDWVDNYIQIAHCRGNHWIAISTIGCDINKIHVYDSLYSNVDTNTEHNIKTIFASDVSISLPSVQKQLGLKDCGVFAIAFATHLAYSTKCTNHTLLSEKQFRQDNMRSHLINCFMTRSMTEFF
uniref:Ubiquitin-like protease family profile domain-containing protein n=1 Tax=Amphimedon queenslandica TaxID=400682 RepID=A0A1X7U6V1_AMPQE